MACVCINVQFSHISKTHDKASSSLQRGHPCAAPIQAQPDLAEMNTESLPTLRLAQKRVRFTLAVRMRGQ
ncbi:hypothetical protein EV672_103274 [Aquabacterium commune]|uniref:Uncharacterized protein n=1 Tax=Aquabacterium commune TaxID=70586 RepID=A0A4R6REL5_9BURK|nr:hypothetical protein EV672_103274 [Aquabacterium commune]